MNIKRLISLVILLSVTQLFSQIQSSVTRGDRGALDIIKINKEIPLHKSKAFLVNFLGSNGTVTKFELDPLLQTELGEQLSVYVYKCEDKNASGLLFTFYNLDWLDNGEPYIRFGYKTYTMAESLDLIAKLDELIEIHKEYLKEEEKTNHIYFDYDDITFIVHWDNKWKMRLLWNGFDSEWENMSFGWAKRKLGID